MRKAKSWEDLSEKYYFGLNDGKSLLQALKRSKSVINHSGSNIDKRPIVIFYDFTQLEEIKKILKKNYLKYKKAFKKSDMMLKTFFKKKFQNKRINFHLNIIKNSN